MFDYNTRLTAFKEDMEENLKASNDTVNEYNYSPLVKLGLTAWDKVDVFPFVGISVMGVHNIFYVDDNEASEFELNLMVYGYTREDISNNSEESILKLVQDVTTFLITESIYKDNLIIDSNEQMKVNISMGSKNEANILAFSVEITLNFEKE